MQLTLELNDHEAARLRQQAQILGLRPEKLARSLLSDLLVEPDEDFRAIAERVIDDNRELHRRLS
ncbi:MAG: DNA-binding protein [Candidatus Latescibacteria bacterium]|nr:DNA-binding protein [Candidatus Latescibacterota bacterium]